MMSSSGISLLTAMEIMGNPKDIFVWLFQSPEDKCWGIKIDRGPGHNYKQLLTVKTQEMDKAEVIKQVEENLRAIMGYFREKKYDVQLSDSPLITGLLGQNKDFEGCLDEATIQWIVEQLRQHNKANTSEMAAPVPS